MKKIFTLIALFGAMQSDVRAGDIKGLSEPLADTSYVYIYRSGQFGGAMANFSVWVDGKKLCKISNGKYFRVALSPGTHEIEAKLGGMSIMKKETSVEIDVVKGKSNYISCNMKQSITRVRLEMVEVVERSGKKDIEKMSLDNCQEKIDD